MTRQYVDRGQPIKGIETAIRDTRLPYSFARSLQNVQLLDGRISRRFGVKLHSDLKMPGEQLGRHTATKYVPANITPGSITNVNQFITPMSYALLRWHTDYQLVKASSKTIEFVLTLGDKEDLVKAPYTRKTKRSIGGSRQNIRESVGVYVFDQSCFANVFDVRYSGVVYSNERKTSTSTYDDIWSLTTLAVSYDLNYIYVTFDLFDDKDQAYVKGNILKYGLSNYVPGTAYHISIVYDHTSTTLKLYVNGAVVDGYSLSTDEFFCGDKDAINGLTSAVKRDIVLLNEFTVRASLASTAKIGFLTAGGLNSPTVQMFDSNNADDALLRTEPLALTPPKGTGIQELRIWNTARTEQEISKYLFTVADDDDATLLSRFALNGEQKVQPDTATEYDRFLTIHSTTPGRVNVNGLVHNKGLHLSDGQYVIRSFPLGASKYIDPIYSALEHIFGPNPVAITSSRFHPVRDVTITTQILTPHDYGQELTAFSGSATQTGIRSDIRESMSVKAYGLCDGQSTPVYVRDENGTAIAPTTMRWHRAFDMTIWSIECSSVQDAATPNNFAELIRIPAMRCLLTPTGHVAVEWFGYDVLGAYTREFRVVSDTILDPNTVYDVTIRRRTINYIDANGYINHGGVAIDIIINGIVNKTLTVGVASTSPDIVWANGTSSAISSAGIRDIIIGASYINNISDKSIDTPVGDAAVLERKIKAQMYKNPWQDQPGHFTLGYFRIWHAALSDADVLMQVGKSLSTEKTGSLIMNIEPGLTASDSIIDMGIHAGFWRTGYKGWGIPQIRYAASASFDVIAWAGWAHADCLGSVPCGLPAIANTIFNNKTITVKPRGLGAYSSTIEQRFGVLAGFGSSIFFDALGSGQFNLIHRPFTGVFNDAESDSIWSSLVIADRTILTSKGSQPRQFNGTAIHPLGFKEWDGGSIMLEQSSSSGSLVVGKYYGVVVAYFSERHNIYQVSPVSVIKILAGNDTIRVAAAYAHPDPRVTNILIGITAGQDSEALAKSAALYGMEDGYLPNKTIRSYPIKTVSTLSQLIDHPDTLTPVPICSLAAAYANRLWLAGDLHISDILYYSDAGNVERFDTLVNRLVLDEGSGDAIVSIQSIFGALFVFKPNSVWRVDELSDGSFAATKLWSVGPVNNKCIQTITIPDTGKIAVVFWSETGPYLFDELSFRYIGSSIEGTDVSFNNVDSNSVFVIHDIKTRQVYFMAKTKSSGKLAYDIAFVYNYRFDVYTTATGIPGSVAFSYDLSKKDAYSIAGEYIVNRVALIGDRGGKIYSLTNEHRIDAADKFIAATAIITSVTSDTIITVGITKDNTTINLEDFELVGVFVTVIDPRNRNWTMAMVNYNIGNTLYLDSALTVGINWPLLIGASPVYVEFPWDFVETPYYQKQLHRLVIWGDSDGQMQYKLKRSFASSEKPWETVNMPVGGNRIHIDNLGAYSEVVKLIVASFQLNFRFDGYGYVTEITSDGVKV
jgi:hypothetical protein